LYGQSGSGSSLQRTDQDLKILSIATNPPAERILDSKMMNSGIISRAAVEKWLDKRQQNPADEASA
jgi:hypothetical protein